MTFSELKSKDVVNMADGRKLGKPIDLVLNGGACVEAIVVPSSGGLLNLIKQDREGCLIPWKCVLRIGDDVILADVREDSGNIAVENST